MLDTSYVGNNFQTNGDSAAGGASTARDGNPLALLLERDNDYAAKDASFRDGEQAELGFEPALAKGARGGNANFLQIDNTSNNSFTSPGQMA